MFYNTLVLLLSTVTAAIYDSNLYTLGDNLLTNPGFDLPLLSPPTSYTMQASIPGWTCTVNCQVVNIDRRCTYFGKTCSVSFTQGVDLITSVNMDHYFQSIQIENSGKYYLSLLGCQVSAHPSAMCSKCQ